MHRLPLLALLLAATALSPAVWAAPPAKRVDAMTTRVTFSRAVQSAAPAVVNIYAARVLAPRQGPAQDPAWQHMLPKEKAMRERVDKSLGSGVIVRPDGVVVTNLHVIDGADAIKVVLADGREFAATLVGQDDKLDLGVLKLTLTSNERLPAARYGESDTLQVGDVVLALGNPFGIGQSVSFGVVSAVQRSAAALSQYGKFIQTDAAINPGNSGGALIDSTGALVGINSAIFSRNGASAGIGFAVPTTLVKRVVDDILRTGRVVRPWFGAEGEAVSPNLAQELKLPNVSGVALTGVMEGSPAANAGLKRGDVLLTLAGQPATDPATLNEQILATPNLLNQPTPLTYWRGGRAINGSITLTALPPRALGQQGVLKGYNPLTGAKVEPLSPALNVEIGLPMSSRGIALVALSDRPLAGFKHPLQPGDVLLAINGIPLHNAAEVQGALDSDRKTWRIRYLRDGKIREVVVQ